MGTFDIYLIPRQQIVQSNSRIDQKAKSGCKMQSVVFESFSKPFSLRFNSAFIENELRDRPRVQKELKTGKRDGRQGAANAASSAVPATTMTEWTKPRRSSVISPFIPVSCFSFNSSTVHGFEVVDSRNTSSNGLGPL